MLGIAASSLSVFLLIKYGFDLGLSRPIQMIVDWYKQAIEFLLGWADPPLDILLSSVGKWIDAEIVLYPHWKHIFVPIWLYIGADAKTTWNMPGTERKLSAIAIFLYGSLIALMASVASATVALDDPSMLSIIFPILGIVVYNIAQSIWDANFHRHPGFTWWQTFRYYMFRIVLTNAALGAICVGGGLVAARHGVPVSNIALLLLFVVLLAVRHLLLSALDATFRSTQLGTWRTRFRSYANTELGFLVLQSLGGTSLFIACNAGLRLAGL